MSEPVPLVEAMKLIRQWPWTDTQKSNHIDLLIEAVLIQRHPSPEWIISLEPDSRVIKVAHWTRVDATEPEKWMINPNAVREIDCATLESAGESWLELAESQIP